MDKSQPRPSVWVFCCPKVFLTVAAAAQGHPEKKMIAYRLFPAAGHPARPRAREGGFSFLSSAEGSYIWILKQISMNYRLTNSLFIGKDKDVISYETKVAQIKGPELLVFGNFSRTTGKHIGRVARLLGLSVKDARRKDIIFHKHEIGVRVDPPFKNCLSPAASHYFLEKFKEMHSGVFVAPTREDWFNAMIGMPKIFSLDWAWICLELDINTKTPQLHSIKNADDFFKPAFLGTKKCS